MKFKSIEPDDIMKATFGIIDIPKRGNSKGI